MAWDPQEAKRKMGLEGGLSAEEFARAEEAAEIASKGPIGAHIRELFEDKDTMRFAMQAMDLTHGHFQMAFMALKDMDDEATTRAVAMGLMMNLVMILKVLQRSQIEILDLCSRSTELASLFEDAVRENGGKAPFGVWDADL